MRTKTLVQIKGQTVRMLRHKRSVHRVSLIVRICTRYTANALNYHYKRGLSYSAAWYIPVPASVYAKQTEV